MSSKDGIARADTSRLVCIGHSHVRAIAEAARLCGIAVDAIDFWTIKRPLVPKKQVERGIGVDEEFSLEVRERLGTSTVLSLIGGSVHHTLGIFVHPRRFDFVLPSEPDLPFDEDAELVPVDCVRSAIVKLAEEYNHQMEVLRECVEAPIIHVEPPPVCGDDAMIAPDLPKLLIYRRGAKLSPRYTRYKLWRLHSQMLEELCERLGIDFLRCPAAAMDSEGFLSSEFYKDPMHVNVGYGRLVLHQLRD